MSSSSESRPLGSAQSNGPENIAGAGLCGSRGCCPVVARWYEFTLMRHVGSPRWTRPGSGESVSEGPSRSQR